MPLKTTCPTLGWAHTETSSLINCILKYCEKNYGYSCVVFATALKHTYTVKKKKEFASVTCNGSKF